MNPAVESHEVVVTLLACRECSLCWGACFLRVRLKLFVFIGLHSNINKECQLGDEI